MLTRKIVFLAAAFLACGGHAAQQDNVRPSLVSREVARSLVVAALHSQPGEPTKLPGFHVELMKKSINEQFYFFEATWSNPDWGASSLVIIRSIRQPLMFGTVLFVPRLLPTFFTASDRCTARVGYYTRQVQKAAAAWSDVLTGRVRLTD